VVAARSLSEAREASIGADLITLRGRIGGVDDRVLLLEAIALAQHALPSAYAFSVGALIVDAHGGRLGAGYTHQRDPRDHAEEVALAVLGAGWRAPAGATLFSSLEPCSVRCTELILTAGIERVVFAWREPELFVHGEGAEKLRAAGVEVVELTELAEAARDVNLHLPV
jgi:diaminohydroxyphosphoribosylaminopyrimidine deaminase/5-amino-6-(5-phosphoribosylamino)uracil reductase